MTEEKEDSYGFRRTVLLDAMRKASDGNDYLCAHVLVALSMATGSELIRAYRMLERLRRKRQEELCDDY